MIRSNTGFYMGISRRAWEAQDAGKLIGWKFAQKYDITIEAINLLSRLGVINGREWHHVELGDSLVEEHFYIWINEAYIEAYRSHKDEIDALAVKFSKIPEARFPKNNAGHIFGYIHDQIKKRSNKNQREEEHLYFNCLGGEKTEEEEIEAMKAAFPQYVDGYQKAVAATAKYYERKAKADEMRTELKSRAAAFFD